MKPSIPPAPTVHESEIETESGDLIPVLVFFHFYPGQKVPPSSPDTIEIESVLEATTQCECDCNAAQLAAFEKEIWEKRLQAIAAAREDAAAESRFAE